MTLHLNNGIWTDENGCEVPQQDAWTRTGLQNVQYVDIEDEAARILEAAERN